MILISHADIFIIVRNAGTVKIKKGNPVPAAENRHFSVKTPIYLVPFCRYEMELKTCPAAPTPPLKW